MKPMCSNGLQFTSHFQQSITRFPIKQRLRKCDDNHLLLRIPPCRCPTNPNPSYLACLHRLNTNPQAISHPGPWIIKTYRKGWATQLIGRHHRNCALFEDPNTIQYATIRQHRHETVVVWHTGDQSSTS